MATKKALTSFERLAHRLKEIANTLPKESDIEDLPDQRAKRVRMDITEACQKLQLAAHGLDPIKEPNFVFDPSNPNDAGRIVGITLVSQPRRPLSAVESFYGSGVYAIYYNGTFAAYSRLSKREHPIYVGKADPTDRHSKAARDQGDPLSKRLKEHARTISSAPSLKLQDFDYRALVVQPGWESAAENSLIALFKPIWNKEVKIAQGIGKHGDSTTTRANLRSPWDTLHPGRKWAHKDKNLKDQRELKDIISDISAHLTKYPPMKTVDEILRHFLAEMGKTSIAKL